MKIYVDLDKGSPFTGETEGRFNAEIVETEQFTKELAEYCNEDLIDIMKGKLELETACYFICGEASVSNHNLIDFVMTFLTDQGIKPSAKLDSISGYSSQSFGTEYFLVNDQGYYAMFCSTLPILLDYVKWYKSWVSLKEKTKI